MYTMCLHSFIYLKFAQSIQTPPAFLLIVVVLSDYLSHYGLSCQILTIKTVLSKNTRPAVSEMLKISPFWTKSHAISRHTFSHGDMGDELNELVCLIVCNVPLTYDELSG